MFLPIVVYGHPILRKISEDITPEYPELEKFEEMDPDCKGFRKAFINAHILERWGDEISRNEGCISIPGIHEDVKRPNCIRISYMDEQGQEHEEEFCGIKA